MPKKDNPKRSGLEGLLQSAVTEARSARAEIETYLQEQEDAAVQGTAEPQQTAAAPEPAARKDASAPVRARLPWTDVEEEAPPPRRAPGRETGGTPTAPQTALDQIRTAPLRAPRPDRRKREPVVSYRGIPEALQRSLERLADERDLPVGVLARFFLEHGLQQNAAGSLPLAPQLVRVGLTLYPEAEGTAPRLRRRRSPAARSGATRKPARPVAFRGIPPETARGVSDLAHRLGVPIGEVARYLLEQGISQVRSGALQLQTYPLPSALRTLYPEE